jgi:DNA-binding transcriptional LysR family regulator
MHGLPPLNGLRAFEAAARHLSLTKAAAELNVSPGAISHQIRGLEALLGVQLFERRVRAIVLTAAGKLLYPGVQTGFLHLREAVAGLKRSDSARVLVVSTSPGLTAKWLAPRLYRFANAHPEIDTRISSSLNNIAYSAASSTGMHLRLRRQTQRSRAGHHCARFSFRGCQELVAAFEAALSSGKSRSRVKRGLQNRDQG